MTDQPTGPTIYNIPTENLPGLMDKLAKLSKKSQKLIGKDITFTILRDVRTPLFTTTTLGTKIPLRDESGAQVFHLSHDVTIDAEVPRIAGWSFLATIDHSNESGNILRVNPNATIDVPDKYRTIGRHCDHCNKIRNRNDTLLLRCDETGEIKQIGRQCVRDFIGYDIEAVVALAECLNNSSPSDSDGDYDIGGMKDRPFIPVAPYLAHVAACVRVGGWVSRKDAEFGRGEATSMTAFYNLFPPRPLPSKWKQIPIIARDTEVADEALAWGQSLAPKNDYEHNLHVLSGESMIARRSTGFLASLITAYMNHKQQEFRRVERRKALRLEDSQHVGAVGDKLKNIPAILFGYRVIQTRYGSSTIYSFQTDDGNVLKWFASGDAEKIDLFMRDATNRTPVTLSGTIKGHSEYNGVKETGITRCKVAVHRPVEEEAA